MKIQIIGYDKTSCVNKNFDIEYTILNQPMSLDEYDVNIINLQNENIWRNNHHTNKSINSLMDFKSLGSMISGARNSCNIIAFPQNYTFCYYYGDNGYGNKVFWERRQLKDMLYELTNYILPNLLSINLNNQMLYENTKTHCGDDLFNAAFCFDSLGDSLTLSYKSEKQTTVKVNNVIYTTLDLFSRENNLDSFLSAIGLLDKKEDLPAWISDINFFDDVEQKEKVRENENKIESLQQEINASKERIKKNLYYKSMLSTNGQKLVEVVFDVLEKILECDLSKFEDVKKEDFLIKKENITFIGEIKGVTSNVKSEHISQVDVHYQTYADGLQETGMTENVKQILVINSFRTKEISNRDEIHENQIVLAKRNGCLIITTEVLLLIFEKFLKNEIESEQIIEILKENVGVLTKEQFVD